MSEYQYYEFVAVDQPLTALQMRELRALSSRAEITATRLTNVYHFGDFRGNPRALMEQYFDAHLYVANWGTRRLMLRLPLPAPAGACLTEYCVAEPAEAWETDTHVILSLTSEDEGADLEDDGPGLLAAILPVRAELLAGDLRALYLAWLLCVEAGGLDDDDVEPPVPPNLGRLSAGLWSLADFLRIDGDLLGAAAAASPDRPSPVDVAEPAVAAWIHCLPPADKDALLMRALRGDGGAVGAELVRRLRADGVRAASPEPRTVGALREAAQRYRDQRRARERAERAEEVARRQREEQRAREQRLDLLAPREEEG